MTVRSSHPGLRHLSATFILAGLAACGTLPADELGDGYPTTDNPPAADDAASPPIDAAWPDAEQGEVTLGACEQLDCGGQSCTDGICNALLWRMQLDGDYDGEVGAMAMTPEGDVVLVGSFSGAIEGPSGTVSSQGRDVFVAKLAWTGEMLWLKRFGSEGTQRATDVAIGTEGQIAIGGELEGGMVAGDISLDSAAQEDGFVLMLDADGHPRWARTFGDAVADDGSAASSEHQTVTSVVVLPDGDVAVAGSFYGALGIGEDTYTATGQDGFVAYLRADGSDRWSHVLAGPGDTVPTAMVVDTEGNLVIGGAFSGVLSVDSAMTSVGGEDAFIGAMDTDGSEIWLHRFGGSGSDRAESLGVDDEGSLFVTGTFGDSLSFGTVEMAGEGSGDGFVARFHADDGTFDDARVFGDGMQQIPTAVSVGPDGDVAVVGWFSGTIDFGLGPMTALQEDSFVGVFGQADLETTWSHRYGALDNQRARAATHHADGALVFAGEYVRGIDLGWGALVSEDLNQKIFVAAVAP